MKNMITFFSLMLFSISVFGQSAGDYRTVEPGGPLSPTQGNWSNTALWEKFDGASTWSSDGTYPNSSTSSVYIRADADIIVNGTYSVNNLTIDGGGKLSAGTATQYFIIVYGNLVSNGQVGDGANNDKISFAFEKNGTATITGTSGNFDAYEFTKGVSTANATTVQIQRDVTLRSTSTAILNRLPASTFNLIIDAGISVNVLNGSVAIDGPTGTGSGERGGTITVNGNLLITQTLYLTTDNASSACAVTIAGGGKIECSSTITTASGAGGNTFTINNGGLLKLTSGNLGALSTTNNSYTFGSSGVIEYAKAGDQTISSAGGFSYSSLTLSGSGTKTLGANTTINSGTLKLSGNASFALNGYTLTYTSATLEYAGSGAQVFSSSEWDATPTNVTINNPNGVSLDAARTIAGTLTINSGSSFNAGGFTFSAASVANNGAFEGTGLLTLSGGGTLSGTGTYPKLAIGGNTTVSGGITTISSSLTLSAGTLTNNAVLTFNDGVAINVTGGAWGTAGTVNYNGTVDVNYSSASTSGAELPSLASALNNVTISAAVSLSSNVTVNGILTLNDVFTITGRTLTLKKPISGTLGNLTTGGTGNITVSGTASGIYLPGKTYSTITINNSNGATLTADASASTVIFTLGNLYTGAYSLTLASGGILSGESAGNYLVGTVKTTSVDNPILGTYTAANLGITLPGIAGSGIVVTRKSGSGAAVSSHGNQGMDRKYTITGTGITYTSTVTLAWVADDLRGLSTSNVSVYEYIPATSTWENRGPSAAATGSFLTTSTVNSEVSDETIVEYTISDNNNPLPVELVSFTASLNENFVTLLWETATEVDNYGFEIYKSIVDGDKEREWELIGFVEGHGNSNSPKNYIFETEAPLYGTFAYCLKQIDFDGEFEFFDEAIISIGEEPKQILLEQNYPNPFNPKTEIRFSLPEKTHVSLIVYSILGEQVAELINGELDKGIYQESFDAGRLASGIYIYILRTNDVQLTKKMLVIK